MVKGGVAVVEGGATVVKRRAKVGSGTRSFVGSNSGVTAPC